MHNSQKRNQVVSEFVKENCRNNSQKRVPCLYTQNQG